LSTAAVVEAPIGERSDVLRRIQEMLGVRRLKSDQDLVKLVEQRLSTQAIESLRRHGVSDEEIYGLVLPRRTLAHRRARREALSRDESDRVVRLARITALASTFSAIQTVPGIGFEPSNGSFKAAVHFSW
jgi:uncharacterized protein (DUF2384 family)